MIAGLPPMMDFEDVRVGKPGPGSSPGVDWPDFESQHLARLLRAGRPVCQRPVFNTEPVETVTEPCSFFCFMNAHFGHLVAESAPRLPQTLAERRDRPLVMTTWWPTTFHTAPPAVRAVLEWWEVAPEQVRFVHQPTLFRHLGIAAQGEYLLHTKPAPAYLALLEAQAVRRGMPACGSATIYVGRSKLDPHKGGQAGEAHLEDCLRSLGVGIVHPERLSLHEQLAAYAEARHMIVAEGSALHGRQLLGRIDQDVTVLVRRPGVRMAHGVLSPRLRSLGYAEVVSGRLFIPGPDGFPIGHSALAIYNVPALLARFDRLGLPLRRVWDQSAYEAARDAQVLRWLKMILRHPKTPPFPGASTHFSEQLETLGLGHLIAPALELLPLDTQTRRPASSIAVGQVVGTHVTSAKPRAPLSDPGQASNSAPKAGLVPIMDFADAHVRPQQHRDDPGAVRPDFDQQHHAQLLQGGKPVSPSAITDFGSPISGASVTAMQEFSDIEVVPSCELYGDSMYARGGPVWPDFETQSIARHHFAGRPVDLNASPAKGQHVGIETPCVWGGYASPHFGSFVAEFAPRLPASVHERPDDLYLFTLRPGKTREAAPGFLWAVLDWYGIGRSQVRFVETPLVVSTLRVAAQGECLGQVAPDPAYLDLLERNASRRRLRPVDSALLYVTRMNQLRQGRGGHAGERYLVSLLERRGVMVLDPASADLESQLSAYAGARHIMFAEGSAIHGRQLLGRIDQRITVLVSRPQSQIARAMIAPRCNDLTYARVTSGLVSPVRQDGRRWHPRSISFYDTPALIETFREAGVDLASDWDDEAFRRSQEKDAADWLRFVKGVKHMICLQATRKAATRTFADNGLGALLETELPADPPVMH